MEQLNSRFDKHFKTIFGFLVVIDWEEQFCPNWTSNMHFQGNKNNQYLLDCKRC